jgi:hypothetical protein
MPETTEVNHENVSQGSQCLVCGLFNDAKLHTVEWYNDKRMMNCEKYLEESGHDIIDILS